MVVYLEADVRRNGRNEARGEVTLPWFQEEGSQPSQLGGYRIILFDHLSRDFCATKLWPKFRVDPPNLFQISLLFKYVDATYYGDILFGLRMYVDSRTREATRILMFQYIK
jgi:hypothetical protein